MGLTLHYDLRLPGATTPETVDALLGELHEFALTLPFEYVSSVCTPAPFARWGVGEKDPDPWLEFWSKIIAEPYSEDMPPLAGDVETARGFMINPGKGCESALFALMLHDDEPGTVREWLWRCHCKTQYASSVSDENFLTCHTSLVALLDHAITLGMEVTVHDEGFFWETRDEAQLLAELHKMNRLIAAFAGHLADMLGDEHSVQAAIFEHPRFEHLEMGES